MADRRTADKEPGTASGAQHLALPKCTLAQSACHTPSKKPVTDRAARLPGPLKRPGTTTASGRLLFEPLKQCPFWGTFTNVDDPDCCGKSSPPKRLKESFAPFVDIPGAYLFYCSQDKLPYGERLVLNFKFMQASAFPEGEFLNLHGQSVSFGALCTQERANWLYCAFHKLVNGLSDPAAVSLFKSLMDGKLPTQKDCEFFSKAYKEIYGDPNTYLFQLEAWQKDKR